jgi:hypothetical protein
MKAEIRVHYYKRAVTRGRKACIFDFKFLKKSSADIQLSGFKSVQGALKLSAVISEVSLFSSFNSAESFQIPETRITMVEIDHQANLGANQLPLISLVL